MKKESYEFGKQDSYRAVERLLARENLHSTHNENNIYFSHEMVIPLILDSLVFIEWFSYN